MRAARWYARHDIRVDEVPLLMMHADVDAYIVAARDTGGMFMKAWDAASQEDREAIEARLSESFEPFAVDDGYALPGVAVVASAS